MDNMLAFFHLILFLLGEGEEKERERDLTLSLKTIPGIV